jgi:hypothetical protein
MMDHRRVLDPIYDRLRRMPPGEASDDIATVAAALELAMEEYELMLRSLDDTQAWLDQTNDAIDDLKWRLGHDAGRGDVSKLKKAVERLLVRVQAQEAAIRTALAKPKSDEAVQALSAALREPR